MVDLIEPARPVEADRSPTVTVTPVDVATLRRLIDQWSNQLGRPKSWDLVGILDYKPFDTAFVARKNQESVGAVTLNQNEVVGLYVVPEERRHGYAEALLKQAAVYCEQQGFPTVMIEVADTRAEALVRKLMEDPAYANRFQITEAYRDV